MLFLLLSGDVEQNPGPSSKFLNAMLLNARSICTVRADINKFLELHTMIACENLDILAVTESWLTDSISSTEFTPVGFECYRRDRGMEMRGGGIVLL